MSVSASVVPAYVVSALDLTASEVPARLACALTPETVAFVRGGALRAASRDGSERIVDANHVIVGRPVEALTALTPQVRCTVVRFARPELLSGDAQALRPCPSSMYLAQWMLFNRACDRLEAASQIERDACRMAGESGEAAPSEQARRVGVHVSSALHDTGNRRLSLDAMASALSLSRFTVSHLFSEYAGITLRLYHRRLRMRLALELLRERPVQLTALALELGFSDQAHFSNTFHAEYGIAPSVLRGTAALSRAIIRKRGGARRTTMGTS